MRIAFACPNFPPEFLGGTERVTVALARALRDGGDEVTVITGSDLPYEGEDVAKEEVDGIRVCRLKRTPDEVYGLDISRPRIRGLFESVLGNARIELLHLHHWAMLTTGIVRAAQQLGIPSVASMHDMWTVCPKFFRRPPNNLICPDGADREACVGCVAPHLALDELQIRAGIKARDEAIASELKAAAALTVPSEACRKSISEHLAWDGPFTREIEVVPHGLLEPIKGNPHDPAARSGKLRIGTFGNLVEDKGVALLVQAAQWIPNVELHLYGPFLQPEFETLIHERAEKFGVDLVCHGAFDSRSAHPATHLDLAVFPSMCAETYGLVVEEALARGVPVVVSDRGALAELVGDGGRVVTVDELGPLADTLRELATNPSALQALRDGISSDYRTISDAARRYRQLYELAIEGQA